ncbi:N-acetylmuramoyl-L-alanine amidase family protein, partial [Limosilactobacillus reuteri]
PVTYLREKNTYVQTEKDGRGVLLGNDGAALSGVQQWAGTYYYFDPQTHLRVDNNYVQSQWGDWYMFGKDGKIVTGLYDYNGNTYYANPVTYLREKNTYVPVATVLLGDDGAALSGVQQWNGAYYYFDPATHLLANKRNYVQSQWGDWYLIGDNGQVLSGLQEWYGSYYYFDPITFLKVTNQWRNNQYFGADGIRYQNQFLNDRGRLYRFDANGNMLTNRWFNDDDAKKSYYFGANGVAYTGRHVINGVTYVFNDDGVRIETIK